MKKKKTESKESKRKGSKREHEEKGSTKKKLGHSLIISFLHTSEYFLFFNSLVQVT